MTPRRYTPDMRAIARAALARGPLTPTRGGMRFGHRLFSFATVSAVIAAGDATRLDDGRVIAVPRHAP